MIETDNMIVGISTSAEQMCLLKVGQPRRHKPTLRTKILFANGTHYDVFLIERFSLDKDEAPFACYQEIGSEWGFDYGNFIKESWVRDGEILYNAVVKLVNPSAYYFG